jgi:hypothetical protein
MKINVSSQNIDFQTLPLERPVPAKPACLWLVVPVGSIWPWRVYIHAAKERAWRRNNASINVRWPEVVVQPVWIHVVGSP